MARIEITVPETVVKRTGEYACQCQKTKIDMKDKQAKVFWTVRLGDVVKEGDTLCELDTGKAVAEVNAPCGGRLAEILTEEGGDCGYGSVMGFLETEE